MNEISCIFISKFIAVILLLFLGPYARSTQTFGMFRLKTHHRDLSLLRAYPFESLESKTTGWDLFTMENPHEQVQNALLARIISNVVSDVTTPMFVI